MLEISIEKEDINEVDVLLIFLKGGLESKFAIDFYDTINQSIIRGHRSFFIDCKELEYISSSGISIILRIGEQSKEKNINIVYFHLNDEIKLLLKFLSLNVSITSTENKDAAIDLIFHSEEEAVEEEKIYSITARGEVIESFSPTLEYEPIQIEYPENVEPKVKTNRLSLIDDEFTLEEIGTSEIEAIRDELESEKSQNEKEDLKINIPFLNKTSLDPNHSTILDSIVDTDSTESEKFNLNFLSNKKDANFTILFVNCGSCGAKIRIKQQGFQKCPKCFYKFILRQSGSISTIEKI
jgi:anti-sigma B factor antagonist